MNSKTISFYIIDDDPIFVEIMADLLEEEGYEVASNCSAVYSLSEIGNLKPDCILVDLQMAEMDGLELCREIRNNPLVADKKIIFVSSHSEDLWKQRANEAGGDGYITKPIDGGPFLEAIRNVME